MTCFMDDEGNMCNPEKELIQYSLCTLKNPFHNLKKENKMADVGKIEFNVKEGYVPTIPKGWPQPKTKESLIPEGWNKPKSDGMTEAKMDEESRLYGDPNNRYLNVKIPNVLDKQIGGSHYKQYKIQPYEFFIVNQIPHHKAAIIRRILRYDHPTGKGLEDLQKIMHEIEMIIQLENWEETEIDAQVEESTC